MSEVFEKFEERFEEIGAGDVFHHLVLGNTEEFEIAREQFDGDMERLDRLVNSVEVFREEEQSGGWEEVIRDFEDSNTNKIEALKHTANLLREKYRFRTLADSGELYVFTNPAYESRGEQVVKEELEDNLQDYLRRRDVREILESIRAKTFTDRPQNAEHTEYVPLQNGWYNLEENRLEVPDPDKFIAHELPIEYDEDADCPRIREFLHEVVEDENVPVLQELIGYCLYRDYPINKAFMLLGDGKNGKSTFLNLLKAFLGEENVAAPSLHTLAENRFAKADLYGKMANIHADLSAQKLYSTGVFKMLTGQDTVRAEKKRKDPFQFKNHAKLVYSANALPATDDTTDAFFRRWIIVEFPYKFTEDQGDEHKDKDPEVLDELTTEEELSGLFNWAVDGLHRVMGQGQFTKTGTMEEIKEEWLTRTNPLQVFVERETVVEQGSFVTKDEFYQEYLEFCDRHGAPSVEKNIVGRKLPQLVTAAEAGRKRIDGSRTTVWKNIVLSGDGRDSSTINADADTYEDKNQRLPVDTVDTEGGSQGDVSYADVVNTVEELAGGRDEPVDREDVFDALPAEAEDQVREILEKAKNEGDLYEPQQGGVARL